MQNAGSLRKRTRRNLSKVSGLAIKEKELNFDNFNLFNTVSYNLENGESKSANAQNDYSARITRQPFPPSYQSGNQEPDGKSNVSRMSSAATNISGIKNDGSTSISKELRPCLLSKLAMRRLKQCVIVGSLSWALPWSWNPKKCQIDRWSPGVHRIWMFFWWIFAIQNTLILPYQVYVFLTTVELENGSYRPMFTNCYAILYHIYAISLNITMYLYRERMRIYINTLLAMNRNYIDEFVIHLDDIVDNEAAVMRVTIPCDFIQIGLRCILFVIMPYQPWYITHYIYRPGIPFYMLIPGLFHEWILTGQVLSLFCLLAWFPVAHGNSAEFWLKEAHNNNDTGQTIDEIRDPKKAVEIYRSLQLLTRLFNECFAPWAFPVMKMINWTALVACGYVLIRSMNEKFMAEFPGILTYPFSIIDCVSCAYGMLQVSAEMFDIATSFLNSWSETRNMDLRRVMLSCQTLRIVVGNCYYVTTSTTITYFQVTFDYITDCIMTFP